QTERLKDSSKLKLKLQLIHGVLCGVALAGDDVVLHLFALLVFHFKRLAVGPDHLDFEFAIAAVQLGVAGPIGEQVLVADLGADEAEDLRQFTLEAWLEPAAAGHAGKGLHLIIRLEEVELRAAGKDALLLSVAARFRPDA